MKPLNFTLKVSLWTVGVALVLLLMAWALFPAWAPALMARQLPEGVRLIELDVGRPGLRSVKAPLSRLSLKSGGVEMQLVARDTTVQYSARRISIDDLSIQRPQAGSPTAGWGIDPEALSIPRWSLPENLPPVEIQRVSLEWPAGDGMQSVEILGVRHATDGGNVHWEAALPSLPGVTIATRLAVTAGTDSLTVRLVPDGDLRDVPLLAYDQSAPDGDGTVHASAEINFDMTWLDSGALESLRALTGVDAPWAANGEVTLAVNAEGQQALMPTRARLTLHEVGLNLPDQSLLLDADVTLLSRSSWLNLDVHRFEATAQGLPVPWQAWLEQRAQDAGLFGMFTDANATVSVRAPGALALQLQQRSPRALTATGGLVLAWNPASDQSLRLGLNHWTLGMDDVLQTDSLSAEGELAGSLRLGRELTWKRETDALSMTGLEADVQGRLILAGNEPPHLDGTIEHASLAAVHWRGAGGTASVEQLTMSGRLILDAHALAWSGNVRGKTPAAAILEEGAMTTQLQAAAFSGEGSVHFDQTLQVDGITEWGDLQLPTLGVSLSRLDLTLDAFMLPETSGGFQATTTGLKARVDDVVYRGLDLDLGGRLAAGDQASGSGELLVGLSAALPFRFELDRSRQQLAAHLDNAELPATELPSVLRTIGVALPQFLTFRGGSMALTGVIEMSGDALDGALDVTGTGVDLSLGDTLLEGIDFQQHLVLGDPLAGQGGLSLRIARLAAGVELTGFRTDVDFEGDDRLGLLNPAAELLGGQIATAGARLVGGVLQPTTVDWLGFDLGRLLAFIDVGGLDGTGVLDAHIPLVTDPGGIAVRDGRFAARSPGRLRYRGAVPATNIGLRALENFEYDELTGTVNYQADGAYVIHFDLLGRNPDLYDGHPIRFRLTLNGQLPALFRSLFLTGNFEESIIEQLRSNIRE